MFNPAIVYREEGKNQDEDKKELVFDSLNDVEKRQELLQGLDKERERKRLEDEKLKAWQAKEREERKRQRSTHEQEVKMERT